VPLHEGDQKQQDKEDWTGVNSDSLLTSLLTKELGTGRYSASGGNPADTPRRQSTHLPELRAQGARSHVPRRMSIPLARFPKFVRETINE